MARSENSQNLILADPIDAGVQAFYESVQFDNLPSLGAQKLLIEGYKTGYPGVGQDLIDLHRGLIAAVAHPFKSDEKPNDQLLEEANSGFLRAAETYDPHIRSLDGSGIDFSDHAIVVIREILAKGPDAEIRSDIAANEDHPMDRLVFEASKAGNTRSQPRDIEKLIKQGLKARLGQAALSDAEVEEYLQLLTTTQREYVVALYIQQQGLKQVSAAYGVSKDAIIITSDKGISRILAAIEQNGQSAGSIQASDESIAA